MSDTSIFDAVRQHIGPNEIQQMSAAVGADPSTTSNAINLALPALVGALANNASHPAGAAALDRALDDHDGSILNDLGGLLGGGGGGIAGMGAAILGHIFGAKKGAVEGGVANRSGLDAQQVAQLLTMLAPIVMAVLGRMKKNGVDATQLPQVLAQNKAHAESIPGLGGLLDANHDGNIADDVMRMGTSALGGLFKDKS